MNYIIREMDETEYPLLKDFLYEAIFVPKGETYPPRSILNIPELQIYISDFGSQKDDKALVAEADGKIVGAVWVRIMNDYGHVDDETPSFAISLYPQYRGCGIGTAMLKEMLAVLKKADIRRLHWQCKKQIMQCKCIRAWDLKQSMKMKKNSS